MAGKYIFNEVEPRILQFWKENRIHEKANELNKDKEPFYFLDGPPYTSGRVHIGTAWNKSLKDLIIRFKRMQGFDVWDRAGYDMHGMPTEQATEKELGLKNKDDIIKFGIEKFTTACKDLSNRNLKVMNEDFKRLGVWMNFDDPYMPIKQNYIEGEWWLIKKAHENNRLYEGEKTMTWCSKCGTALAKHELEYEQVTDDSIFLKFPIVDTKNEFLIIWTTTPWTIPYNLGVMVNPKLDYVKAKVDDEIWVVAKGLVGAFISSVVDKKFEIIEEFKGDKLEGVKYTHPLENELKNVFQEVKDRAKSPDKVHTVVLCEEYVDLSAGTGLVHMAPGCGPEDYEIGYRNGIPPFNELSHSGVYSDKMGKFSGFVAKRDDKKFIEAFDETGSLVASTKVDHDYAHCWRCKSPVVYRTTTQWFFKIEDLKDKMRELNKDIEWVPDFAGSKNFDSWLANLRDNGITRQRFWGTPLPVWKCDNDDCKEYLVVGSVAELKEHAINEVPKDLHKPWIDKVKCKCDCGSEMTRSPDILDVWIDSGSASWNCLNFPQETKDFDRLFPADFILEGIDQIRGWFNLLLVASMVSMDKPSFKSVYMHGFVQDAKGRKMSKSLGNYILPGEVIEKYGADTLRYYMISGSNPGIDINYNFDDMKIRYRNLHILWNLQNYLIDIAKTNGFKPKNIDELDLGIEEKYIVSKANSLVKKITERLNGYFLNEAPEIAEELYIELSRVYVQLIREKLVTGSKEDKELVFNVIYYVFFKALRIFSVSCPFITEEIYQNLKSEFGLKDESIFLMDWVKFDEDRINTKLEGQFDSVKGVIQSVLHLREKIQLGQRWPLKEAVINSEDKETIEAVEVLKEIIIRQTKVKDVVINKKDLSEDYEQTEFKKSIVAVNKVLDYELKSEGFAREIMRRVQNLRRKNGLQKNDEIDLCIVGNEEMTKMLEKWADEIALRVGAKKNVVCSKLECKMQGVSSVEKIKGEEVTICFEKI
jgi:isoleucyl-tRNA synthetase